MRATVYVGLSVDGFIARPDGGIDWLMEPEFSPPDEDFGFAAFFQTVDALVMGRNTFELAISFPHWPYGEKRLIVLSSRPVSIPEALSDKVEWMSGSPAEILSRLAERGIEHVYVDGGKTVQGFLAAGLVQRMVLTRLPILIGEGIPLFGPLPGDVKLRHVGTHAYPSGLIQTEYEVIPPSTD
jgi:dihydrofolate reductase